MAPMSSGFILGVKSNWILEEAEHGESEARGDCVGDGVTEGMGLWGGGQGVSVGEGCDWGNKHQQ
jgi:hypothetical protein